MITTDKQLKEKLDQLKKKYAKKEEDLEKDYDVRMKHLRELEADLKIKKKELMAKIREERSALGMKEDELCHTYLLKDKEIREDVVREIEKKFEDKLQANETKINRLTGENLALERMVKFYEKNYDRGMVVSVADLKGLALAMNSELPIKERLSKLKSLEAPEAKK